MHCQHSYMSLQMLYWIAATGGFWYTTSECRVSGNSQHWSHYPWKKITKQSQVTPQKRFNTSWEQLLSDGHLFDGVVLKLQTSSEHTTQCWEGSCLLVWTQSVHVSVLYRLQLPVNAFLQAIAHGDTCCNVFIVFGPSPLLKLLITCCSFKRLHEHIEDCSNTRKGAARWDAGMLQLFTSMHSMQHKKN